MKIVTDTNKFYDLGADIALLQRIRQEPITPTFISLRELTTTGRLNEDEEKVRSAIQAMLVFENNIILEPPFLYLGKIYKGELLVSIDNPTPDLVISKMIASGEKIIPGKEGDYYEFVKARRVEMKKLPDLFNSEAARIQEMIKGNERQRLAENTLKLTVGFICECIDREFEEEFNFEGLDSTKFELLLLVLDLYFKKLETGQMKFKQNDLYDFAILAYVQPGDKFWTSDGRWLTMIRELGMDSYLYTPPS